jgi:hypothetical protein
MPVAKFNAPRKIDNITYHEGKHVVSDEVANHFYFKACMADGDINLLHADDDTAPGRQSTHQTKSSSKGFTASAPVTAKTEAKVEAPEEKEITDEDPKDDGADDISKLSYEDLLAKAAELNLSFDKPKPKKVDVIAAIQAAQVQPEETKNPGEDLA